MLQQRNPAITGILSLPGTVLVTALSSSRLLVIPMLHAAAFLASAAEVATPGSDVALQYRKGLTVNCSVDPSQLSSF